MHRTIVQVVKMRMGDLQPGDIVNKNPDDPRGWFVVTELEELPNNGVAVLASSSKYSINGTPHDIVGVQVRQVVDIPQAPAAAEAGAAAQADQASAQAQQAAQQAAAQAQAAAPQEAPPAEQVAAAQQAPVPEQAGPPQAA